MSRTCTIGELVRQGELKQWDFVDYVPDDATYTTNSENTGCKSQILTNQKKVNWRVVFADRITGEALILSDENLVEDVCLNGIVGYMNGSKELDTIAFKLGSNSKLGIEARCPTIEDVNKINGYILSDENARRYAYYPSGSRVSGAEVFKGKRYERTSHWSKEARFYTSDGGGVEKVDENGFSYRVPHKNNPVLVTKTGYYYNTANSKLGNGVFWLASPCVDVYSSYADFSVRYASSSNVYANILYYSDGSTDSNSFGVRPLVSLSSMLQMDISDEDLDGSTSKKAWRFAKLISSSEDVNEEKTKTADATESHNLIEDYNIVYAFGENLDELVLKVKQEVKEFMKQGYEPIGNLQVNIEGSVIILCRELVKK